MNATNASLASLLFFGVTSLAIDICLTTTSNSLILLRLSLSLRQMTVRMACTAPSESGSELAKVIATGRVLVPRRLRFEITETTAIGKSDLKTKPKPKTNPKGKTHVTSTGEHKEASQVLEREEEQQLRGPLSTKGCRPKNCRNCGKATDAKGGKRNITDLSSLRTPTLIRYTATFPPASKTKAGLKA